MFHHDAKHVGVSSVSIGSVSDYGYLWAAPAGSPVSGQSTVVSSPIVGGGDVFAAGSNGSISAYSSLGVRLWTSNLGSAAIVDTPAYDSGNLFVEEGGILYSLSGADGSVNWSQSIGTNDSSPTVTDGQVFVAPENGTEESFDESTGSPNWTGRLEFSATYNSPTVGGGLVFTGDTSCVINALSESTGATVWQQNYDEANIDASPAYFNGAVVGTSMGGYVFSRSAPSGASNWLTSVSGAVESSPAVYQPASGDAVAVFGTDSGSMYGVDESTGAILWSTNLGGGPIFSSPAVSADGVAFVGTEDGDFVALDVSTGSVLWNFDLGTSITASPAITSAGVYVTGNNGYLYLFWSRWPAVLGAAKGYRHWSKPSVVSQDQLQPQGHPTGSS
jgi:outer membrane protein assembly factor BamB